MRWIAPAVAIALVAPILARAQTLPHSGGFMPLPPVDSAPPSSMQMQMAPTLADPAQSAFPTNQFTAPATLPAPASLRLADLESLALSHNPTLREADARLKAAQGVAEQAGLYPNPTVGYSGELIGAEGTAGEFQGAYIQQTIITANKLKLSRMKYLQEVAQNQLNALAQRERVLNGVRTHYIRLLAAQQMCEVQKNLLRNADDAQLTAQEMVNVGQANHAQLLQAQVTARRKKVELAQAEIHLIQARRDLAAFIGVPCLPEAPVGGRLEQRCARLDWNSALAELLQYSPELSVARLEIRKDQFQLERERVQPIPNLQLGAGAGYNFENPSSVANVNVGIEVPLFNRNQGTIRQAEAEVVRASAEAKRTELALLHQLAHAFRQYDAALASVEDFEAKSLQDARQAYQLLWEGYQQRRAPWTDVLQAERIYFELSAQYIHDLGQLREAEIAIRGLLLVGGLEAPGSPVGNHIDATPQPR